MNDAPTTLSFDIGGTRLKAGILDEAGTMIAGPVRVFTPHPAAPATLLPALTGLVEALGDAARAVTRITAGFPGVVRSGVVLTAPNLGNESWYRVDLATHLSAAFGKPARVLNDASVQGLGVIAGNGVECVITLGTGMGFALFRDGALSAHVELGQHPARTGKTYDQYVGLAALREVGAARWNRRVRRAVGWISTLTTCDTLLIGGGNAKKLTGGLAGHVRVVENSAGITGGVKVWALPDHDLI